MFQPYSLYLFVCVYFLKINPINSINDLIVFVVVVVVVVVRFFPRKGIFLNSP